MCVCVCVCAYKCIYIFITNLIVQAKMQFNYWTAWAFQ